MKRFCFHPDFSIEEAIVNLQTIKAIQENIQTSIFIYRPPKLETVAKYIKAYDFSNINAAHIVDLIYGLSAYCISKENVAIKSEEGNQREGIGFVNMMYQDQDNSPPVFEIFFYNIYKLIEIRINEGLKTGIDNVWKLELRDDSIVSTINYGRTRFSGSDPTSVKLVALVKENTHKN